MNNKKLILIFAALLVILGVLLWRDKQVERPDEVLLLVDSAKVTDISIKNASGEVIIKREGSEWRIKQPVDWPVQSWTIQNLLNSIDTVEVEYVVTEDKTKYAEFELDDAKGTLVTITEGGKKKEFVVGTLGGTWRHTHMRIPGRDEVFLTKGAIRSAIVKKADDWRDRRIFNYNQDSLTVLKATLNGKPEYTLEHTDSTWQVIPVKGKPFRPDGDALMAIIAGIARTNVGEFVTDSVKNVADFSKPLAQFQFTLKDGTSRSIEFATHPSNKEMVLFRVDGKPDMFGQWKSTFDMFAKGADGMNPATVERERKKREAEAKKAAKNAPAGSQQNPKKIKPPKSK